MSRELGDEGPKRRRETGVVAPVGPLVGVDPVVVELLAAVLVLDESIPLGANRCIPSAEFDARWAIPRALWVLEQGSKGLAIEMIRPI